MQIINFISTKERILILIFSFLAFTFFAAAIGAEIVEFHNNQVFDAELRSKGISFRSMKAIDTAPPAFTY